MIKGDRNKMGQYFTPVDIARFMIGISDLKEDSRILEPSCGEGVFVRLLKEEGYNNITAYEVDEELAGDLDCVIHRSFISEKISGTFDLVIGNPPYVGWKNLEPELKEELRNDPVWNNYFNSLCDYLYIFMLKSIMLLREGGQLVFICPEYWMNTTHSLSLRNYMVENGYFETIIHFNETPIFKDAKVSTVIFKYVKSDKPAPPKISLVKYFNRATPGISILNAIKHKERVEDVEYLDISAFEIDKRWLLESEEVSELLARFSRSCIADEAGELKNEYVTIGDVCDIGNGMVTGLDKAFQIDKGYLEEKEKQATIQVVKAKDLVPFVNTGSTTYIHLEDDIEEPVFIAEYPMFYKHLLPYKEALGNRYQYKKSIRYWDWVFRRNYKLFLRPEGRIFVPFKDRISNKDYLRFALVDKKYFPTQDVTALLRKESTKESLEYIVAFLNTEIVFTWVKNYGIVKGNIVEFPESPLSAIPFRKIDWNNQEEVRFHDYITKLVMDYRKCPSGDIKTMIDDLFNRFLGL